MEQPLRGEGQEGNEESHSGRRQPLQVGQLREAHGSGNGDGVVVDM